MSNLTETIMKARVMPHSERVYLQSMTLEERIERANLGKRAETVRRMQKVINFQDKLRRHKRFA